MRPRLGALAVALALDLLAGEPRAPWHPVRWVGRALRAAERRAPDRGVGDGAAALLGVVAAVWAGGALAARALRRLGPSGVVLEGVLLKPAFAVRALAEAAARVEQALRSGDLVAARTLVGRDLVSRPVTGLDPAEVASATIESVGENLVDSVLAPLLAYAAGGLPAAWAYRALNTADALWGYRDGCYERFGKAAARLDDLANLVPARLGAAALAAGAALAGEDGWRAARMAWRDHGRTTSPNAGWAMAAMAGALDIALAKRGAYRLGDGTLPDGPDAIRRARRVFALASVVAFAVAGAAVALRGGRA